MHESRKRLCSPVRAVERNGTKVNSNNDNFNNLGERAVSTALVASAREGQR